MNPLTLPLFMGSGLRRIPIQRELRQTEIAVSVRGGGTTRGVRPCVVSTVERPGQRSRWAIAETAIAVVENSAARKLDAALSRARQPRLPGLGPAPLELEPQTVETPATIRYLVLWSYESAGGEWLAVASYHYSLPSFLPPEAVSITVERLQALDAEPVVGRCHRKQLDSTPANQVVLFRALERLLARPRWRRARVGDSPRPVELDGVRGDRLVRLPAGGLYPLSLRLDRPADVLCETLCDSDPDTRITIDPDTRITITLSSAVRVF